jgi:hypothetical protein
MSENNVSISTVSTILDGCRALRSNLRATLQIALFTMFLPQLAGEFYFGQSAGQVAGTIWKIGDAALDTTGYFPYVDTMMSFFSNYMIFCVLIWALAVFGYLSLIVIFVEFNHTHVIQPYDFALKNAARLVFPRGLIVSALIFAFSVIGQSVLPLFIFAAALALMAPVLIVIEGRGGFAATWQAVTIRFAKESGQISRWAIFFCMSGIIALLYLGLFLLLYLNQQLLTLDVVFGLSRSLWSEKFAIFPFSLPFIVGRSLELAGSVGLICILPPTTVHLYFQIKRRVSLLV